MGLIGVTACNKGLQRVTSCYKELQGVWGAVFFFLHINDLSNRFMHLQPRMYADVASITYGSNDIEEIDCCVNIDLDRIRIGYDCAALISSPIFDTVGRISWFLGGGAKRKQILLEAIGGDSDDGLMELLNAFEESNEASSDSLFTTEVEN